MARQSFLFLLDTLSIHAPQRSQEGSHVLPQPSNRMDDSYPAPSSTLEQATGHGVGLVELGYGASPFLCFGGGGCILVRVAPASGADHAATAAGVLLRSRGQ